MTTATLHTHFLRSEGACTDSRKIFKGCMFFALKGPSFNGNEYALEALEKGASYAVVDEDLGSEDPRLLRVDEVLSALQELGRHHRRKCQARILALTGSNGKTTTKELLREVLCTTYRVIATEGNLNNHIGVPMTLLRLKEDTEIGIIEMGANHQGEIAFLSSLAEPDMGLITNFGKAHLEGFGGIAGVIQGKSELYDYLKRNKHVIFMNGDDPVQREKLQDYVRKVGYSTERDDFYRITLKEASPFVRLQAETTSIDTQLSGAYNFNNAAVALLVGKYLNVAMDDIARALQSYIPANNRSQWVESRNHRILMDAYNANPSSMKVALENFAAVEAPRKIVILGDMFELGDASAGEHQAIADLCQHLPFDQVYLVGKNFYKTEGVQQRFEDFKSLQAQLEAHPLPPATVLIKGSRGMALERLLPLFQTAPGTVDPQP